MFTSSFMMPTYLSYMPLMYPQGASAPGFPAPSAATTPTLLDVKASSAAPSPLPLPASVPASAPVTTSSICVSSLRMETPHEIQAKFLGACNCSSCSSVASSKESSCGSIDSKTGSAFSQIDDDLIKGRLSLGLGAKPESSGMYPGASLMSMGMGMGMGMGMPRGMPMSLPPGLGMPMVSMFSVQSPYGLPMSYPGVASTPAVEVVPTRPLALDHTSASAVAVSHNSDENSNRPYTRKRNTTKRYHCSECPKKFHQRSNLITHVRTHTGEKPFACPFPDCQRRFSQSSNLRRHQRIHSRDFNGTSGSGSTSGSTTSVPISSLVSPSGKPSATISERSVSPNSEEDEHDSSDSERDENGLSAILEADEKVAASSLTNLGTSAAQTTVFAAAK